ncbi:MAG TPA: YdcF family protein [Thermoanaerobaculia bacterium]|nr:YdcF family protein [Thermoanaerobaculia bacterium]
MIRRRHARRIFGWFCAGLLVWLLVLSVQTIAFSRHRSERPSDAAIVLGAAVQSGRPSPVFAARLDHAIDLHRRGIVRYLILTGGIGKGDSIAESQAGAAYAVARGVPAQDILTESVSHTTLQNLTEARRLLRSAGLRTCLLVSDPLHMRRAHGMLRDLGVDARPSPTPSTRYRTLRAQIPFLFRELYFHHHYVFFGE